MKSKTFPCKVGFTPHYKICRLTPRSRHFQMTAGQLDFVSYSTCSKAHTKLKCCQELTKIYGNSFSLTYSFLVFTISRPWSTVYKKVKKNYLRWMLFNWKTKLEKFLCTWSNIIKSLQSTKDFDYIFVQQHIPQNVWKNFGWHKQSNLLHGRAFFNSSDNGVEG